MAPHMLSLLLLTAPLAGPSSPVSAVGNSLPVPSIVAPVFSSLPCLNRTVSAVANSLPGPSNAVAPLVNSSLAPPMLLPLFLTASVPSRTATQSCQQPLWSPTVVDVSTLFSI